MDIERQLRDSLAARDPGTEFDAAVLARLAQKEPPPRRRTWRMPAALAAAVIATAFGLHWHFEQQRAVRAGEQLTLALQITSYQLNQVQRKLARTEFRKDEI